MKNIFLEDFIGIWDNALTKEECDDFIVLFDSLNKMQLTRNRQESEDIPSYVKDDTAVSFQGDLIFEGEKWKPCSDIIHMGEDAPLGKKIYDILYSTAKEYIEKYPTADQSFHYGGYQWKIQKSKAGGGYHVWHKEYSPTTVSRTMTFVFYLNTIEKGGETQFLYYPHQVEPEEGRLLVFPAGFQHTNRGNIHWDKKGKYIITGWLYVQPELQPRR